MKKTLTILSIIAGVISLNSCSTIAGAGADVQRLGQGVQKTANDAAR